MKPLMRVEIDDKVLNFKMKSMIQYDDEILKPLY